VTAAIDWFFERSHGEAGAFHAREPHPGRSATIHTVDRPTLALGSAQRVADVDARVAAALGVDVVQRRSGGGAVLLLPGEFVWLDLVIPVDDPLWLADVGLAMVWVGVMWQRALADLGVDGSVHRGGLVADDWSRQVCWTGVGTGEVMAAGSLAAGSLTRRKLVGISQRRTRSYARFQSMCHLRWQPELVAALVSPPRPTASSLAPRAACVPIDAAQITAALLARLP
jgi:lipoate-protein ligase A